MPSSKKVNLVRCISELTLELCQQGDHIIPIAISRLAVEMSNKGAYPYSSSPAGPSSSSSSAKSSSAPSSASSAELSISSSSFANTAGAAERAGLMGRVDDLVAGAVKQVVSVK